MTRFTQFTGAYTTAKSTVFDDTNIPALVPADNVQEAIESLAQISITKVDVVPDITTRDALTPDPGDVAKVINSFDDTGVNGPQTYIYTGTAWIDIQETSNVISVNGKTQTVVLDTDDINEAGNLYYTDGRVSANLDVSANTASRHNPLTISVDGISDEALSISPTQVLTGNLVTDTNNGFMSTIDKDKLDNIDINANLYIHPNHSGDVVSVTDGVTTIQPNVVDNVKLSDVADNTIKGRIDPGTGNPQDLTPADVRTIINVEDGSTADQIASEVPLTPNGNLTSTEVQAGLEELQLDIDTLNAVSHDAVSAFNSSITVTPTQAISVTLDFITGGGDNNLVLGASGLYVEPVKVNDDSLVLTGQTLNVNIDTVTNSGNNILSLTASQGLYVPPSVANLSLDFQSTNVIEIGSDTGTNVILPSATTLLAGLMSSADKTKLDGIETGATADQIANEVPVTPVGNLVSTNVQASLQELQGDIDTLTTGSHVPASTGNDSLTTSGTDFQTFVVNLDSTTSGGNNALSLTPGSGLYVAPDLITSVNGQTGTVILDTDDINESGNLYYTEGRVSANVDVSANTLSRHDAVTLGNDGLNLVGQQISINLDNVTGGGDNALVINGSEGLYVPPATGTTNLGLAGQTNNTLDITSSSGTDVTIPSATGLLAGLLTAPDKVKLDTIEMNAAGDQLASEVPVTPAGNLSAINVQAGLEELQVDIDLLNTSSHDPFSLNGGIITQGSTNLIGQELELIPASASNSGVLTNTAQTIGGVKTFITELPLIIDSPSDADDLQIGYISADSCYGINKSGTDGSLCLMSNSQNPTISLGSSGSVGASFIDSNNNSPLNLNILDTGAGTSGIVNIGSGGLRIFDGDLNLTTGDITLNAGALVDNVDISTPKNSIEVDTNQYQLVGDVASPGNNFYYGTDSGGAKGWYETPSNSVAVIYSDGGSDNTINYNTVGTQTVQFSLVVNVDTPDFTWNTGTNQLTCNFDGFVQASYNIPIISFGSRNHLFARFQRSGVSFTGQIGTSYSYIRNATGNNNAHLTWTGIITVQNGDALEVLIERKGNNASASNMTENGNLTVRRLN